MPDFGPFHYEVNVDDARGTLSIEQQIEQLRRPLAEAFRTAEARGADGPTLFVAISSGFVGLAFARALYGERSLRTRQAQSPIVGCDARIIVGSTLFTVDPDGCRALLELHYDDARECPVVFFAQTTSVITLSRESLMIEAAGSSLRRGARPVRGFEPA